MKVTPDDYGRRCQFDHFASWYCTMKPLTTSGKGSVSVAGNTFETLPLRTGHAMHDRSVPQRQFIFPAYGCELQISDGLVAAAFASLPQPGQSILILHCVLELTDGEIGAVVGMSRSAVQRHRTKTLSELRKQLKALMPKGG